MAWYSGMHSAGFTTNLFNFLFFKMVKEIEKDGRKLFQCEECSFLYKEKEWAEKCEDYCREKHSCSLDITKHAVKPD